MAIYGVEGGVNTSYKKAFVVENGQNVALKKSYVVENGKYVRLWVFGTSIEDIAISYSGKMTDEIVTMSDGKYRLLTLTSSGTLTVDEEVNAEVWMCNGGNKGQTGGSGGGGGYVTSQTTTLGANTVAVVGSGGTANWGGQSSFGTIAPSVPSSAGTTNKGASGGGSSYSGSTNGRGARITTYPFGDTLFFVSKPHSAGGGGGGYRWDDDRTGYHDTADGGSGASNGGNGYGYSYNNQGYFDGGSGGSKGGGHGGAADEYGENATFYGSGGGGGGSYGETTVDESSNTVNWGDEYDGGNGYQGVIYIRIPLDQNATRYLTFTVDDTIYKAPYDVTWKEWVESGMTGSNDFSAGTGTYVMYGAAIGNVAFYNSGGVLIDVSSSSKIIAGAQYKVNKY